MSTAPAWNRLRGPGPPSTSQHRQPVRNSTIAAHAATPSRAWTRSTLAGRQARRISSAAPVATVTRASGLAAIQASSPGGNAPSAAGCAQYADTDNVTAQQNAATPPGYARGRSRRDGDSWRTDHPGWRLVAHKSRGPLARDGDSWRTNHPGWRLVAHESRSPLALDGDSWRTNHAVVLTRGAELRSRPAPRLRPVRSSAGTWQ